MTSIRVIQLILLSLIVSHPALAAEEHYFTIAAGDVASGFFDQAGLVAGQLSRKADCTSGRVCDSLIAVAQARPSARAALSNLRSGTVEAALVPSEQVYDLVSGPEARSWAQLRALLRVEVQPLVILARPDLQSVGVAGLAGQRLVLGARGTDRAARAKTLLQALGLSPRTYREITAEGLERMVSKVTSGAADAVVLLGDTLDAATLALLAEGQVKMLMPSKIEIDHALLIKPYLQLTRVRPAGGAAVASIATSSVLVVRSDLSAVDVTRVLNHLWASSAAELPPLVLGEESLTAAQAIQNLPLPLHGAAEAYYATHKVIPEEAHDASPQN